MTDATMLVLLRRYYGISHEMLDLFVKGLNWFIIGNLMTFNYKVYHGRQCIMTISEVQNSYWECLRISYC